MDGGDCDGIQRPQGVDGGDCDGIQRPQGVDGGGGTDAVSWPCSAPPSPLLVAACTQRRLCTARHMLLINVSVRFHKGLNRSVLVRKVSLR